MKRGMQLNGWVLLSKDEGSKAWHIAWDEIFPTKKNAMEFAKSNGWCFRPFKAVRATLSARP